MPKKPETKKQVAPKKEKKIEKKPAKTVKKAAPAKISEPEIKVKKGKYWQGVGRRKSAIAVVKLFSSNSENSEISVNSNPYFKYFPADELQKIVDAPLKKMKLFGKFEVNANASGGGMRGQAEAIRLGISRALVEFNPEFRKRLKRAGYLTRDARVKERKKYGLKKARKAPQWAKR